ncbi:putative Proteasome component Prs3 [Taphrina deformans PYCC 5710]|uniref:Proteasome subunit beta n=1 Tax=Taphrina deformans (strain PYCC 5710 / ATCC 11124 / CBS 356.35 / IMI 108563 / JCM 9778 / NBRC 8474) TaxID=1097556 RepID=R4XA67_TAPDE|nr:putative Proteasome component Prs3 [Taphrina deformans PYCC 5710]|eukprot:CCG82412.1 putative Proteasome component Prs3 [Taphrina deformans PYCC 5710]
MSRFNPYTDNGGSILAIAGADFSVIAGDTRHTAGYSINTRYAQRSFNIGDNIVVSVVGYMADGNTLIKRLQQRLEWYHHQHAKAMSVQAVARLIQTMLYGKRFFPYYVTTIVAGVDEHGVGAVYSFDPVGSYEREQCRSAGAASSLIMPFLDNQVNLKNQYDENGEPQKATPLELSKVLSLCRDAFTSATERHIEVGDGLEFAIVTKEGVRWEYCPLKKD